MFFTVFVTEQGYCYPLHKARLRSNMSKNSVPIILKTSPSTNNCIVHHPIRIICSNCAISLATPNKNNIFSTPASNHAHYKLFQLPFIANKHQTCHLRLLNHHGTKQTSRQTPSAHMSVLTSINYEVSTQIRHHGLRLARMPKP